MKEKLYDLGTIIGRLDRRYIQLTILVVMLVFFVLAAGAPDGGGGTCTGC